MIGDHQARRFIDVGAADQEDFSDNARRLEERLASLGLLKRLSDSCAYVENPFPEECAVLNASELLGAVGAASLRERLANASENDGLARFMLDQADRPASGGRSACVAAG